MTTPVTRLPGISCSDVPVREIDGLVARSGFDPLRAPTARVFVA